ncbi:DoxX family protein [Chlamydiales bacterium]|nr:DoxX family protein [Chlamydiales bacterium]
MGMIQNAYDRCMGWTVPLQSILLFIIRIIWGVQFVFAGWGKLSNLGATTEFFESLSITNPETMALTVGCIELICGLFMVFGLIARLTALPLVIVMIGAYITAHTAAVTSMFTDFEMFTNEAPFLFLYASLLVLAFGPGRLSLDYLIRNNSK